MSDTDDIYFALQSAKRAVESLESWQRRAEARDTVRSMAGEISRGMDAFERLKSQLRASSIASDIARQKNAEFLAKKESAKKGDAAADDKMKKAARMAGKWWADRLADEFAASREAFAASVEKHVLQELRGECHWDWRGEKQDGPGFEGECLTEFDYDPHYCLIPALAKALPDVSTWKLRHALPQKHELRVTAVDMRPKEGYGNWTATIGVDHGN